METFEKQLRDGKEFNFESEDDMVTTSFRKTLGGSMEFIIELNCRIIHLSKSFRFFQKKLVELKRERNLMLVD